MLRLPYHLIVGFFFGLHCLLGLAGEQVDLHVFWSKHCPHCLEALPAIRQIAAQNPWLVVRDYEITGSPENLQRFEAMAKAQGATAEAVPTLFYCGHMEVGWDDAPAGRSAFVERLRQCHAGQLAAPGSQPESLNLPLFGPVDPGTLSLPLLTLLLAGLDAFNPCAFFVLLFLLSLLTHQRQRSRMLLIGGVFVTASGLMYFAFMAAWLNLFLVVGSLPYITALAGGIALLMGLLNAKDFFAFKQGVTLSIGAPQKADIFQRSRHLLQADRLPTLLAATVLLAIAANFYELLCTAGFPMVFTRLLTLREHGLTQHYLYLALYNLIYVLPLIGIMLAFVYTLGTRKLSEREGRLLKLLSGLMMLGLGILLLWAPDKLDQPAYALALPALALAVTWLAARLTRE